MLILTTSHVSSGTSNLSSFSQVVIALGLTVLFDQGMPWKSFSGNLPVENKIHKLTRKKPDSEAFLDFSLYVAVFLETSVLLVGRKRISGMNCEHSDLSSRLPSLHDTVQNADFCRIECSVSGIPVLEDLSTQRKLADKGA